METIVFPNNKEKAQQMEAYMKHHFRFAGVPKPERALLQKALLKESQKIPISDLLLLVKDYYMQEEREYQYLAIDLVQKNVKRLSFDNLVWLLELVLQKEWWDSIDSWQKVYSTWGKLHQEVEAVFKLFEGQEDFWLRRIAITLQLGFKEQTDVALLERAIDADRSTKEFFIQKAIGWSLRDYSKTNPLWVKEQLTKELSKLATREASKYL
ncbi:DNA alkylation repair protein [Enterococcus mundtii]|uniref:DNA alkylation repair protein n=1 Tax=Enterococcus TaxID=1350 RepID=UPI0038FC75E7